MREDEGAPSARLAGSSNHPGDSNDWQNEIHPNGGGYEKLARVIEPVLERVVAQA